MMTTSPMISTSSDTSVATRPRPASLIATYSRPTPRLRNMPRFSETIIGTSEATRKTAIIRRRNPALVTDMAAKATGVSTAMLPPQLLVYGNGAAGRGTGKPKKFCTLAKTGWTSSCTNGWVLAPRGSTYSISAVKLCAPPTMPT